MATSCRILADSISPASSYYQTHVLPEAEEVGRVPGVRLTTFEVTFPRFILAEVNTHRMLSRNSASSRAIPPEKIIERVLDDPFIPKFNKRVKGMGVGIPLTTDEDRKSRDAWLWARDAAVDNAEKLLALDVDKSRINRLLEPFMWHTAIITATEWSNFFALRTDENAQPEFRELALLMQDTLRREVPVPLDYGQWHLPLVERESLTKTIKNFGDSPGGNDAWWDYWKKVSVGRCARVSYLTHDGKRDPEKDIELHDQLMTNGHLSPFEHVARPLARSDFGNPPPEDGEDNFSGNLRGWHQYRADIPYQNDYSELLAARSPGSREPEVSADLSKA